MKLPPVPGDVLRAPARDRWRLCIATACRAVATGIAFALATVTALAEVGAAGEHAAPAATVDETGAARGAQVPTAEAQVPTGAAQVSTGEAQAALGAGEAFLLLRFDMVYDPQMGRPARLRLGRLGSDQELVVFRQAALQVLKVPAGRYYLRGAESGLYDSAAVANPPPADAAQSLDVAEGAAVYVGDYVFDEKRKLTQRYTRSSLRAAQENAALARYPLKVAKSGAATMTIARE